MFDISWSEFLLIGVVALIVIGPKELPGVMRTLGQWTRKVRGMASEFQNQFQEAMREAEMADLKKEVDDLAHDVKNFDPLKDVRDDLHNVGEDVQRSLTATPEPAVPVPGAEPAQIEPPAETPPASFEAAAMSEAETPVPVPADAAGDGEQRSSREMETAAIDTSGAAEPVAQTSQPESGGTGGTE
jgi:sec-independent protein translocase protein TatB